MHVQPVLVALPVVVLASCGASANASSALGSTAGKAAVSSSAAPAAATVSSKPAPSTAPSSAAQPAASAPASAKPAASAAAVGAGAAASAVGIIKVSYGQPAAGFAPLWIAQDQRPFKKYGLNTDVVHIAPPADTQSLISGDVHFVLGGSAASWPSPPWPTKRTSRS